MDASDWDRRYGGGELVWSSDPNIWVRELCTAMAPGRALDVAAGEGRNGLWLAEHGWTVLATDFSPVAVARMGQIADRRLAERRAAFTAHVADATEPPPQAGGGLPVDLALLVYLHLPREQWRAALASAVHATAPGGSVVVVAHAVRNLRDGVGGPQDPSILLDPDDVVASADGLPVEVSLAELRRREVTGSDRPALDAVVLFHRLADSRTHTP